MTGAADLFDIPADREMFERIVADAAANGGSAVPNDHWTLPDDDVQTLGAMLAALIGPVGMQPFDHNAVRCFEPFLRGIDHLGLCGPNLLLQGLTQGLVKSDLGTMMDLNLTTAYLSSFEIDEPVRVCEVGGGYGRVAKGFLDLLPGKVHYVLVDAVPGSLMYAYLYLRKAFPERRIGSVYSGDTYDPTFDCFILPAWRTAELPDGAFDLAVNIESMQEMDGHHIDAFIALFDRVTAPKATIYISNARDYVYQGEWRFPAHWETLFQHNTPRSWSADHPTIIMRKGDGDFSIERRVHEAGFQPEIAAWNPGLAMLVPQK